MIAIISELGLTHHNQQDSGILCRADAEGKTTPVEEFESHNDDPPGAGVMGDDASDYIQEVT